MGNVIRENKIEPIFYLDNEKNESVVEKKSDSLSWKNIKLSSKFLISFGTIQLFLLLLIALSFLSSNYFLKEFNNIFINEVETVLHAKNSVN